MAFDGIKTNMIVVNGELQLDNSTTGTYEFDTYGDLGSVQTGRVVISIFRTAYLISDTIDDRLELIDDWRSFDNLPVEITENFLISTTDDDPSVSPTWSDWIKFSAADYKARAFRFKLEITTASLQNQISISELTATISTIT